MPHAKNQAGPRPPATPWIPAALLGLGLNVLAAGAIALGAGAALGAAMTGMIDGGSIGDGR